MKKILLYTDTPQTGGAELQMFLLAKFLGRNEFKPILCCSNYQALDKWCKNFEKEEIKVIRLNVKHKHDPRHYTQLKKIIKKEEIDLLHAHVWNPASCRYAFPAADSCKIPIVTTEHDPFKLSPFKNTIKKNSLKKISKIITVSENNKKILKNLYPKQSHKIRVIHNGIDTTWWKSQLLGFSEEDYIKTKKEIFHAHENTFIVTTIAELHERKGLKYLIKAIPGVVEKHQNVKFIFIGDGPDRGNLESLVEKMGTRRNVEFLGKQKEIPKLLKSSNLFVLPSKREAFGLVNLEAMMIPLPIIATSVGGIPEIIQHKKTGLLVKPKDSKALEIAIKQLINSKEAREKMAEAGHNRVINIFDAKNMAKQYEKIYQSSLIS